MKKLITLILVLTLALVFTSCGESHTWSEATCTDPMICSDCNETKGQALGHTTDFGICERCEGEIDENDMISRMSTSTGVINDYLQDAASYYMEFTGISDGIASVDDACYYLGLAKTEIENFIAICHENEKTTFVAAPFEEVLDKIPTEADVSTDDEFYEFLDNMQLALEAMSETVDLCLEMTGNVFDVEV